MLKAQHLYNPDCLPLKCVSHRMLEFQLFRLKVTRPAQPTVWGSGTWDSAALIRNAIEARPERAFRRGFVWHIGNVGQIDDSGLYFAFGRTTRATHPFFDSTARSFVEQEFENAPYTHVIVDVDLGLCAIAKKTQLAQDSAGIARQLARLLNDTQISYETGARYELDEIKDPEQFIELLYAAIAVLSFSITFSRPNPFDANEDFQLPMERLLQETEGNNGQTTIEGPDLDRTVLEELSRSAAATGNNASARVLRDGDARPVRRHLRENKASLALADMETEEERSEILRAIRDAYLKIRHRTNE